MSMFGLIFIFWSCSHVLVLFSCSGIVVIFWCCFHFGIIFVFQPRFHVLALFSCFSRKAEKTTQKEVKVQKWGRNMKRQSKNNKKPKKTTPTIKIGQKFDVISHDVKEKH